MGTLCDRLPRAPAGISWAYGRAEQSQGGTRSKHM